AVGQTMVIIGAGIDLSVGAVLALSASMSAVAVSYWGLNLAVGILLGLGTGALTGFITGVIITKGRIPDFVATLAMMTTAAILCNSAPSAIKALAEFRRPVRTMPATPASSPIIV
ncbi:unnamed protein product, partial [marine sediment metagenome]